MGDFNALTSTDFVDPTALARLERVQAERGWAPPAFALMAQATKAGYVDAYRSAGGSTWPAATPDRRIDYILYPSSWADVQVSGDTWATPPADVTSDHLPVYAEFLW